MKTKTEWLVRVGVWYLLPDLRLRPTSAWGTRLRGKFKHIQEIVDEVKEKPEMVEVEVVAEENVKWYLLPYPEGVNKEQERRSYNYSSGLHAKVCALRRQLYREQEQAESDMWHDYMREHTNRR